MERKTYKHGDTVRFVINDETLTYKVQSNHLSNVDGNNSTIFTLLDIADSREFCTNIYGYTDNNGGFPEYISGDYIAANKVIIALFDLCEAKSSKAVPKISTKSPQEVLQYFIDLGIKRGTKYLTNDGSEEIANRVPTLILNSGNPSHTYIDCGIGFLWEQDKPELFGGIVGEAEQEEAIDDFSTIKERVSNDPHNKALQQELVRYFIDSGIKEGVYYKNISGNIHQASRDVELYGSYIDCGAGYLWQLAYPDKFGQLVTVESKEITPKEPEVRHPTLEEVKAKYPNGTKVKCVYDVRQISDTIDYNKSSLRYFEGQHNKIDYFGLNGFLYYEGKWAEIIEKAPVQDSKILEADGTKQHVRTSCGLDIAQPPSWDLYERTFPDIVDRQLDKLRHHAVRYETYPVTPKEAFKSASKNTNKVESLPLYKIKQF